MAIQNRDLDQSLQKEEYSFVSPALGASFTASITAGASIIVGGPIPYYYTLENVRVACLGVSGAIAMRPLIGRFAGGFTVIVCGTTIAAQNFGTSGTLGASFLSGGSTLLLGQPGDYLGMDFFGANTAISTFMVDMVVRKTADVATYNGI